jgi:hypothetical protein
VLLVGIFLSGCFARGGFNGQTTNTSIGLNQKNYVLLKSGAKGESSGFILLFIPFFSPTYAEAKEQLYRSVGIDLTGKAVALANQTEDVSAFSLILFTIPKVTLTADVVEFVDSPQPSSFAVPPPPPLA